MPAGRPTVVTDELLEQAKQYIGKWQELGEAVPSIEGLAVKLDVARSTLYDNEQFSDILEAIKAAQALTLINGSLNNRLNSTISKLMLSKHGYVEKSETDVTSKGESINKPDPELAAKFAEFVKNETQDA